MAGKPRPRPLLVQPDDPTIRLIALTKGQVVIVDADRYEWACQWNWWAIYNSSGRAYYAARHGWAGEPRKLVLLHRQLLGEPDTQVDHWNGNTLDCRVCNLRACTPSQNSANRRPPEKTLSGYPGVHWHKRDKRWQAQITVNYKQIFLGHFENQADAIQVRLDAERRYHAEFAFSARRDAA